MADNKGNRTQQLATMGPNARRRRSTVADTVTAKKFVKIQVDENDEILLLRHIGKNLNEPCRLKEFFFFNSSLFLNRFCVGNIWFREVSDP